MFFQICFYERQSTGMLLLIKQTWNESRMGPVVSAARKLIIVAM